MVEIIQREPLEERIKKIRLKGEVVLRFSEKDTKSSIYQAIDKIAEEYCLPEEFVDLLKIRLKPKVGLCCPEHGYCWLPKEVILTDQKREGYEPLIPGKVFVKISGEIKSHAAYLEHYLNELYSPFLK
ncbi:MAG: hypothetical protein QW403_01320 [Candidatus Aenigmatarchaeota archaeon]